ncbi:M50 family metallopeptidase [Dyella sp. 2HG41-7]|uniref:M50 family metallopeptidase n=1 Tax=Dyella sp. 2HG41-7 TaxID=2883239 RepID=UPI001F33B9DA|nr:M50 family metallopeptidase [Dyella sp. 2HG41-7]
MRGARIFASTYLLLIALWLPKSIAAWAAYGRIDAAEILTSDATMPHFWYGWFASLILMGLVIAWFRRGSVKYPFLQLVVLLVLTVASQFAIASQLHLQDSDPLAFDAITIVLTAFLVSSVVASPGATRNGRHATPAGEGLVQWVIYLAQNLLMGFGFVVAANCLTGVTDAIHIPAIFAWFAASILFAICVLVHEGGHFLGAKLSGMKVLLMRVLAMECYPRQGRWLVRWKPNNRNNYSGLVYAAPDPARSLRRQMIILVIMGPTANAIACVFSLLIALVVHVQELEGAASAFATMNGVMALANMLPRSGKSRSDGALLLQWWRHKDDGAPELAHIRLISRSVFGATADKLEESDIEYLESKPMPTPLIALWYRLKAAQNRADWFHAQQIGENFEAALSAWEKPMPEFNTLIAQVRAEVAFSSAMVTRKHDPLNECLLTNDLRQLCPALSHRFLALKAYLSGAEQEARRLLQIAAHEANRSIDLALSKSEAMLGRYVTEESKEPS